MYVITNRALLETIEKAIIKNFRKKLYILETEPLDINEDMEIVQGTARKIIMEEVQDGNIITKKIFIIPLTPYAIVIRKSKDNTPKLIYTYTEHNRWVITEI